jgi:hypothetical protein
VEKKFPGDCERLARMSLIEEGFPKQVRTAFLACIGSRKVNGVAEASCCGHGGVGNVEYEVMPEPQTAARNGWCVSWVSLVSETLTDGLSADGANIEIAEEVGRE